ncbi:RrF2 family transcriptional regulator [Gordonia shandongensis]|uniref:RrF2 family transcriptional regulator n=1 Tax=Gordonia shandongensis TaxID=376351 RepID=UPI0004253B97|nr:Rrf2 family transcriptional regulator [Gordonia shandongensis]
MQLTRFTDIGLRVVMALAADPDSTRTSRQLADDLVLSYTHTAKVVSRLAELGVVHSRRGRTGGLGITELGRSVGIGWLARRLEGDHAPVVDCDGPEPCPLRAACRLRSALDAARDAFYASLDGLTIADLVADPTGARILPLLPPAAHRGVATRHCTDDRRAR